MLENTGNSIVDASCSQAWRRGKSSLRQSARKSAIFHLSAAGGRGLSGGEAREVEASVARCLRTPPDRSNRPGLDFDSGRDYAAILSSLLSLATISIAR